MAKILAFAGSNSSTSINYKLVVHTTRLIENHEIQTLNMAHYPFPMFSEDLEKKDGYSNSMVELRNDIQHADALLLSVNEHNGLPSTFFKNLLDWLSRIDRKFVYGKKILLMSTSPGKRGAIGALEAVKAMLPRFGGTIVATFSLPSFNENFTEENGITDGALKEEHGNALNNFLQSL